MDPRRFERSFADFIGRHALIVPGDAVIAAVSGGVDSMVMLRLLLRLRDSIPFSLAVAHVNHRLRGPESDADEELVRSAAAAAGLPFHLHRSSGLSDGGHGGIQERARDERYRFFGDLARQSRQRDDGAFRGNPGGSDARRVRVATAHQRDDNAETVLFNFLRGGGVRGLAGIPVERADGLAVRPLLFASRAEILGYAAASGVDWREDAGNDSAAYTRNAIRRELLPAIERIVNPGIRRTLAESARIFAGLDSFLREEAARILPRIRAGNADRELRLDAAAVVRLHPFLAESVLRLAATEIRPGGVGRESTATLLRMAAAPDGAACEAAGGLHAAREGGLLVLRPSPPPGSSFDFPVEPGDSYRFRDFAFSSEISATPPPGDAPLEEWVDADAVGVELRLRSRREGDWFIPLGMADRKKLSDYLIDRKIPATERDRIPLLVSGADIVWVCGERLDHRFRITSSTTRFLRLRYSPEPG